VLIYLKYEITNSYSLELELFVKFIFTAIDGSVNFPLWKMKFTPRGKFTLRLRTTGADEGWQ